MVGAMVDIACGRVSMDHVQRMLNDPNHFLVSPSSTTSSKLPNEQQPQEESKRQHQYQLTVAPSEGLYLQSIDYPSQFEQCICTTCTCKPHTNLNHDRAQS
jgi:tRNA U38,U39,U40 pseudouridine synthase TruA